MRVFAASDLHVDHTVNYQWLCQLSKFEYSNDVLILAGDVTDDLNLLGKSFDLIRKCFRHVVYVPGNHELWTRRCRTQSSFEKFAKVNSLANECGIGTDAYVIGDVKIIPLYSWYDYTFGKPNSDLKHAWMDFRYCNWNSTSAAEVTEYFLNLNNRNTPTTSKRVITFSHFLPRIDVMPEGIPEKFRYIYPVLGTTRHDDQIRLLNSSIHVYGHSHVNRNITIDGINYINNAYGGPNESHLSAKELKCILYV